MQHSTTEITQTVARLAAQIAQDLDPDTEIGAETMLIRDLGFASVDFVRLIVDIEKTFARKLGFLDLLMPNGKYVNDLAVGDFTRFIGSRLTDAAPIGAAALPAAEQATEPAACAAEQGAPAPGQRVTRAMLEQFRSLLPAPDRWAQAPESERNARAVFILCAPRSGSTLLRVILAGHPHLFAPPELHMLDYATLPQRQSALDNKRNAHLLTGAIRALMQARHCAVEVAEELMRSWVAQGMSTSMFYRMLQESLGDRLLVDKTPTYSLHPAILERAEQEFDGPMYIHLVRHPAAMIRSFEDAKLDQLIPFMRESSFTRRQIAEMVWLLCEENIHSFLGGVPGERHHLVRFEELVTDPETTIRGICDFVGLPFHPATLNPYEEQNKRMTDGLHAVSEFSGDLKFHLHSRIEPAAAERWHGCRGDSLSESTRELGLRLGYRLAGGESADTKEAHVADTPRPGFD